MKYNELEAIETGIYLKEDYDEKNPCTIYFIDGIFHVVYNNTGSVRYFKTTKIIEELEPIKGSILNYRGIDSNDTLTFADVFIQGAFIKEVYPTKEIRVYFVDSSLDDYDDLPTFSNDCDDDTFMDFAERQGSVYTLERFTLIFNKNGSVKTKDHFIRFIEVLTFS
jgi:hypothetical protein